MLLANPLSLRDTEGPMISSIFKIVQQDTIMETFRTDKVILTFGAALLSKVGLKKTTYVSQRMREIARLLIKFRRCEKSNESLSFFINPSKLDAIVQAMRSLCSYQLPRNGDPATIGIPSLALNLAITYSSELQLFVDLLFAEKIAS